MGTPVPRPRGWPLVGNALDGMSIAQYHEKYGPIFELAEGPGKSPTIFICSVELVNEICNEKRFVKIPKRGGLVEVRNLTHDGLFTAKYGEGNWDIAHRILLPVFNGVVIKNMFDEMHDIASQLVLKWARLEPGTRINATEDFTRLTLDTLALTTMDTRFNSFYSEKPHPFVSAMVSFLIECGVRSKRPSFVNDYVFRDSTQKYWENIQIMRDIGREVIHRRRHSQYRKKDLIDAMIYNEDPKTGLKMTEESIIDNITTFLIAGHETTSGLLSFMLYRLLTSPEAMLKAKLEVDAVLGQGSMTPEMLSRLPYLTAVIRETLRLHPTAPAFSVVPKPHDSDLSPILIGRERYEVGRDQAIVAILQEIHKDPLVFGEDADKFRPERMLDEHFYQLPKGAYKPFGNGARACIGRGLALQEATMAMALLIQNFDFDLADPDYTLAIKKTLTIKPAGFEVIVKLRPGLTPTSVQRRLMNRDFGASPEIQIKNVVSNSNIRGEISGLFPDSARLVDLVICYGSNTGTCQTLAHTLAKEAPKHGFSPSVVSMDEAVSKLITNTKVPLVVITASYEGEPPDNATSFIDWLRSLENSGNVGALDGHFHAVFGCGHRDWVDTFQKVPTWLNKALAACGSKALVERGSSDVSLDNTFNEFDTWSDNSLWPALSREYHSTPGTDRNRQDTSGIDDTGGVTKIFEIVPSNRVNELQYDGREGRIVESRLLTTPGEPEKRHIRIQLPEGVSYNTGDYISILPVNPDETVRATMNRFGLPIDAQVLESKNTKGQSEDRKHTSVYILLKELVELNHPATDKNVRAIALSIPEKSERDTFEMVVSSKQSKERRPSALHLLLMFPSATLSFSEYLSMIPPLHIRRYSISSSPITDPNSCTLTYSVVNISQYTEHGELKVLGTASNYLAELDVNDRLLVSLQSGNAHFRLPTDMSTTPIFLVCSGSGLAPFRAFVQERAAIMKRKPEMQLAECILFIGCRHPEKDALYVEDFEEWEELGAVEVQYAFSTAPDRSYGCRYVQDRVWESRERIMHHLINGTGKMFFCGSKRPLEGVTVALIRAYAEQTGETLDEASKWFRRIRNQQFSCDVFN